MTLRSQPDGVVARRLSRVTSGQCATSTALTEPANVVLFVGGPPPPELFDLPGLRAAFANVLSDAGRRGADNDERGERVEICAGPREPWSRRWRSLRRLG